MTRKKQKTIAVADCETDPFDGITIPEPFIWGYYDGKTYEEFLTTEAFIEYCYSLGPTILYAHNGGKFDWHFILDYIDDFSRITVISGRLAKFKIGEVEFRDSMNILPVSLKKMQKDEFDYSKMRREVRHKHMPEIKRYLYHDCLYLHRYVTRFLDEYGLHLTQAGAALKTWEKMMVAKAPNDMGGRLYEKFSPFYYGGRCEPFRIGQIKSPVRLYDINSAYPYAMLSAHPFSLSFETIGYDDWQLLEEKLAGPCFIELQAVSRGAFPYRDIDKSLIFPTDNVCRTYYITGWELLAGIETGAVDIVQVSRVYCFDDLMSFQGYIKYFYDMRMQAQATGDNAGDLFAKILMNSLYGKFGANPAKYQSHMVVDPAQLDENGEMILGREIHFRDQGRWQYAGRLGNRHLVQRPITDEAMRFYHVGCAASITGYVRAMLWRSICQCDGVVYCDTDSLFVTGKAKLSTGKELGQWKLEAEFSEGAIAGKKLYAFLPKGGGKAKVASKGTRLDVEDIYDVADGKVVEFEPEAPTFSLHHAPRHVRRIIKMSEKMKKLKDRGN